jgi:hypothetical protein
MIGLALHNDAGQWSGRMTLRSPSSDSETLAIQRLTIDNDVVTFTVPNKKYESGNVTYRAVLTTKGLEGTAEYADSARASRSIGSWRASKANDLSR